MIQHLLEVTERQQKEIDELRKEIQNGNTNSD
jgi:hypothetical protein